LAPSSPELLVPRAPGLRRSLTGGLVLVRRAARGVLLAYGLNLVLAVLLGAVVFDAVKTSLGTSLAGERMRAGWDARWYESFAVQSQGVAATFRPAVAGPGGVLEGLDAFLDGFRALIGRGPGSGLLAVSLVYLLSWSFFGAAFIGSFADRPPDAGFLARGARWFARLLPLTVLGLVAYGVLLGPVRGALADRLERALHDVVDERTRLLWTAAAYAALWLGVLLVNLTLDYAKVLLVLRGETGRAAAPLRALGAAVRLIVRRPGATIGLYVVTGLIGLLALAAYVAVVPVARDASAVAIAGTFLLGQLLVLGRVALRALFLAGEVVLAAGTSATA
jgi:hypothetical protein